MFITATMNTIESGTPIQAGMSTTPRNGNVKWSIHTPNMHGIDAATNCPISFTDGESPRKSSTAPTTVATAAPSSTPSALAREVEERERRYEDPEEDREPAEPRDRTSVDPPRVRPIDCAEHPRHPADGRRQEHDDDERDDRPVQDFGRRTQLVEHQRYFVP